MLDNTAIAVLFAAGFMTLGIGGPLFIIWFYIRKIGKEKKKDA